MFCRSNGTSVCISCGTVLMAIGCPMFSSIAVKRPYSSLTETHSSIGKRAQSPAAVIAAISASAMFSLISKPSAPNGISPVVKPFASASSTTSIQVADPSIAASLFPSSAAAYARCRTCRATRRTSIRSYLSPRSHPTSGRSRNRQPRTVRQTFVGKSGCRRTACPAYSDVAVEPSPMRERTITDKTGTFGS